MEGSGRNAWVGLGPRVRGKLGPGRQMALSHAPCRRSGEERGAAGSTVLWGQSRAGLLREWAGGAAGRWDPAPLASCAGVGGSALHLKSRRHVALSLVPGRQPPGLGSHPIPGPGRSSSRGCGSDTEARTVEQTVRAGLENPEAQSVLPQQRRALHPHTETGRRCPPQEARPGAEEDSPGTSLPPRGLPGPNHQA